MFGEDSEYEAQYVEAAYGEFLEGIRDSGYLEDGEGLIDYKMSMLADEDWARLNGYTEEDMQFKLLSGDDEVDDRHNLGGKYGTKDQSNKSFYRELNRVRKIERTVNTKRRRINQYKEKNRDREKDSKYYRDLEKEAARISAEEEEKLRLSNSYDEVLQVSYDEYLARKYVSEKIGRREELSDYRVILLSVESDGSVIILHTSGDPLEKAGNEYNERVNEKNSPYGIQGRNYEKLFHPISEMEGMIRQGQIVKYESGKLFSPVAYGMNYELARLNYEERFERGIKGALQVGLGTMRTAIGGAMLSGSGICASMSSGLCLNAVTVQMAALGASEVGFGINDMILGGSNIGSAYSSSKDTGYDFVKEYKALRTAGPTSNPSLGKELNILKGFLGENYDMMNTSSMMTGGMYGLGMAEYYVRNQRQDEFKILGNNRIFINDGTPGGTGEVKSVTVGNSRYIINKIYSPSSDSAVIKVLNRATGEVSSTVINGSTVAERALTQIGNTAGYDLVSRMNSTRNYPVTVYNPQVEALSTVNYFNTLQNVQGIGYNHSADLIGTIQKASKTTFTEKGSISPTKVGDYGISYSPVTKAEKDIADSIMKNGDLTGGKTEELTRLMAQRMNAAELSGGRYYSDQRRGFDIVLGGPKGSTLIIESKQPRADGGTQLSSGARNHIQLTDDWINAVNGNIYRYNNENYPQASTAIMNARNNGNLYKAVSVFDRNTGKLIIIPVE